MANRMPDRILSLLAVLAVSAAGILLPAGSFAGEGKGSGFAILAPREGAVLPKGNVLVIGKVPGRGIGNVELYVNNKGRQVVECEGGGFSAKVPLAEGKNVIRLTSGDTSVSVAVTAGEKGRKGAYVYHDGVEKCGDCHKDRGNVSSVSSPRDTLCYGCHDRQDKGKLAHGPMGNGDCAACHDPHGSAHKALTKENAETLCLGCHDQKSSEDHFRKSRGKPCTSCHDPHSSNRAFLLR